MAANAEMGAGLTNLQARLRCAAHWGVQQRPSVLSFCSFRVTRWALLFVHWPWVADDAIGAWGAT